MPLPVPCVPVEAALCSWLNESNIFLKLLAYAAAGVFNSKVVVTWPTPAAD
ncbi:MAG: hypothetical protein ACLSAP_08270 [Oscillospiraceae bacterium]